MDLGAGVHGPAKSCPNRDLIQECSECSRSLYQLLCCLPPLSITCRLLSFVQYIFVEVNTNFDGVII
jgi:hypothetical protein